MVFFPCFHRLRPCSALLQGTRQRGIITKVYILLPSARHPHSLPAVSAANPSIRGVVAEPALCWLCLAGFGKRSSVVEPNSRASKAAEHLGQRRRLGRRPPESPCSPYFLRKSIILIFLPHSSRPPRAGRSFPTNPAFGSLDWRRSALRSPRPSGALQGAPPVRSSRVHRTLHCLL